MTAADDKSGTARRSRGANRRLLAPAATAVVIAVFALAPVLFSEQPYLLHILTLACLYAIPAVGLNLMIGYTGLISLGHAAFVGVGGYAAAVLMVDFGAPWWLAMIGGIGAAGGVGFAVGIPSLRLRDHSFIIVTLAFGMILFLVMNNWDEVTRGAAGFPGIPRPGSLTLFGEEIKFFRLPAYYLFTLVFTILAFGIQRLVVVSDFGRTLMAIKQDETLAASKGVNVGAYKIAVFTIGSAIAGLGGVLQVMFLRAASPLSYELLESINYIMVVIIGGAGSLAGPLLGALVFVALPEYLRVAKELRLVVFGLALVLITLFARRGLAGLIRDGLVMLRRAVG
jgi:branched-chain amino acid transport system permease protein